MEMPDYWKSREEVWARTFEAWVQWRANALGIKNQANERDGDGHADTYDRYPNDRYHFWLSTSLN
jgi:hypothetical protein